MFDGTGYKTGTVEMKPATRMESRSMAAYRGGMNVSCIIGRKLGVIYDVPTDLPSEVDDLLRALDARLSTIGNTL